MALFQVKELRNLAAAKVAREKSGQTLQPTALVHEDWIDRHWIANAGNDLPRTVAAASALFSRAWVCSETLI